MDGGHSPIRPVALRSSQHDSRWQVHDSSHSRTERRTAPVPSGLYQGGVDEVTAQDAWQQLARPGGCARGDHNAEQRSADGRRGQTLSLSVLERGDNVWPVRAHATAAPNGQQTSGKSGNNVPETPLRIRPTFASKAASTSAGWTLHERARRQSTSPTIPRQPI